MPSLFDAPREKSKTPQYYLWSHPQSPYAIELRLDIIDRLMTDLRAAQSIRLETGGLLIGTFVRAAYPTLRIEDYEIVGRGPEDGLPYNLTNEQKTRFAAVRHKFISKQIRVLGFFRSQIRGGPLALSAEDRELLSAEFRRAIHIALLIRLSARPTAGFLVPSATGEIQNEPAWNQFPFETEELSRLSDVQHRAPAWQGTFGQSETPEPLPPRAAASAEIPTARIGDAVQPRELAQAAQAPGSSDSPTRPHPTAALRASATVPLIRDLRVPVAPLQSPPPPVAARPPVAASIPPAPTAPVSTAIQNRGPARASGFSVAGLLTGAALLLIFCFTVWGGFTADLLSGSNRLDLAATETGTITHLEWNHDMVQLRKADSALLTIQDGPEKHEISLSPAELKAGSVAYRRHSSTVVFTMTLNLPDSLSLVQSVTVVAGSQ